MESKAELKPDLCPFCSSAEIRVNRATQTMGGYCQCLICGAEGPVKDSTLEAVVVWNQRPTDPIILAAQKVADLGRSRPVAFLSTDIPVLHKLALEFAALLPAKEQS